MRDELSYSSSSLRTKHKTEHFQNNLSQCTSFLMVRIQCQNFSPVSVVLENTDALLGCCCWRDPGQVEGKSSSARES